MKNSFNDLFALTPDIKQGTSRERQIMRPNVGVQGNRAGTGSGSQGPYVYRGGQRQQTASTPRYATNANYYRPGAPTAAASTNRSSSAAAGRTSPQGSVRYGAPANNQIVSGERGDRLSVDNFDKLNNKGLAGAQAVSKDISSITSGNNAGSTKADGLRLDFSEENLLRGLIMTEVLGRPKCFRTGR